MNGEGPDRPGDLRALRLVARRELTETLRRKAVWITAGLFFLASLAAVILPDLLSGSSGPARERTVATWADDGTVGAQIELLAEALDLRVELTSIDVEDLDPTIAAIRDGDVDALVRLDTEPATIVVEDEGDTTLLALLSEATTRVDTEQRLRAVGLDDDQVAVALSPSRPAVEVLDTERGGRQLVALVAALVMYLLLLVLAMQIANGVAVEKSSRVSEVLLAVTSPRALLFGKVIGVGLVGLITIAAGAIPIGVRLASGASVPPGTGPTLAAALVFSILGLALYLCIAGAMAALVERTEDVSSTVGPLTAVLIIGYLIGQAASDSVVGLVLAIVPFTSPMVMPSRVALGEAGGVEVAVSVAALAVTVYAMARFATVVYRRAIVRTGQKVRLRDLRSG